VAGRASEVEKAAEATNDPEFKPEVPTNAELGPSRDDGRTEFEPAR
jgi:hypothetical protein